MDKMEFFCLKSKINTYDLSYLLAVKRYIKNNIKFLKHEFKEYKRFINFKTCDSITYNKFLDKRNVFYIRYSSLKRDYDFINSCLFKFTDYLTISLYFSSIICISDLSYDYVNDFFDKYKYSRLSVFKKGV